MWKTVFKVTGVAVPMVISLAEYILERRRRRKREKATKDLDSKVDNNFLYLMKQMECLKREFENLKKITLHELNLLRPDSEKNQGKKEEEIVRALESRLEKKLKDLSQRIQTLEEDVHEWPESTKLDLQILRADLEKELGDKEEEIARALESKLEKKLKDLSQRIQDLEKDAHEWPESTKLDLQILRADPEKNKGKKEEEIVRALESKLEKKLKELSQRIQTLEKDVHEWPESTKLDLQILRVVLEKELDDFAQL